MTSSSYRPEIDGLRAIAVLSVVLYHANLGVPGGYVGVDVFFVISGYLITGIILRAQEADRFSLLEFWERRLRRIFPALSAMVVATLGVACYVMLPNELEDVGKSAIAQALFVANVFFWQDTNYFAGPAELKPLLHTWSLAVEEQFYFLLPVLLIALKKQSRQRIFNILITVTIVSFLASLYGVIHHDGATFFLLPTRAWELCFGCLLAASPWKTVSRPKVDHLIAVVGLIGVLGSMFLLDSQTPFPGLAALPSVAGATAILYATGSSENCAVGRLLAFRPLVFVGLISYSLYLWHWPVLVFMKYAGVEVTAANVWLFFVVIGSLAVVSWWFIEKPFREQRLLSRRKTVFLSSIAVSFVCVGLAAVVVYTEGLKSRFQGELLTLVEDTEWRGFEYRHPSYAAVRRDTLPALGVVPEESGKLDFVLWGDSHGMVMSYLFDDVSKQLGLSGVVIARAGRVPLPNVWNAADTTKAKINQELIFGRNVLAFLAKERPRNLFLVSRWSAKCEGMSAIEVLSNPSGAGNAGMVVDAEVVDVSPGNCANAVARQLANLIRTCEQLGIAVWIVKQVPECGEAQPAKDLLLRRTGVLGARPDTPALVADHDLRQQLPTRVFNSLAAGESKVKFLNPSPYFYDANDLHQMSSDGRAFYRDDDHLTRWGLERLRPLFLKTLTSIRSQAAANQVSGGQ